MLHSCSRPQILGCTRPRHADRQQWIASQAYVHPNGVCVIGLVVTHPVVMHWWKCRGLSVKASLAYCEVR
jgi:hypothetical protein